MALVLVSYAPLLRMAQTDIWVMVAESAESEFNLLGLYIHLFRRLLVADRTAEGRIAGNI